MQKGFEIGQSNEVIKGGKIYDLHNQYDLIGVLMLGKARRLRLFFEPNAEHGKGNCPIFLDFEQLDFIEFSPNFGTRIISGLDEIGYKNPEDRDDEWLMDERQATPDDHLYFRLDGVDFIRIHCRFADLHEAKLASPMIPPTS